MSNSPRRKRINAIDWKLENRAANYIQQMKIDEVFVAQAATLQVKLWLIRAFKEGYKQGKGR